MMPERQKPSVGRGNGQKRLCFTEVGPPPPKASADTLLVETPSATSREKGAERSEDSQEHQSLGWEAPISGSGCEAPTC